MSNIVEIEKIKACQILRAEAVKRQVRENEYHEYIALHVNGGFLDREPGSLLEDDVKQDLMKVRAKVDEVNAQNAILFHDLVVAQKQIGQIAADNDLNDAEKIAAIKAVEL